MELGKVMAIAASHVCSCLISGGTVLQKLYFDSDSLSFVTPIIQSLIWTYTPKLVQRLLGLRTLQNILAREYSVAVWKESWAARQEKAS
jgi:hypothetical protein